jgi:hypothetical protein
MSNPVRDVIAGVFVSNFPELFSDTSGWRKVATKNWAVAGGRSMASNFKVIFGGEAKILVFTQLDLKKSAGLLLTSASIGSQLGLHLETERITRALGIGSKVKDAQSATGLNPLDFSPDAKVHVNRPFCFADLHGAMSGGGSVGATFGVEAGVSMTSFHGDGGRQLFSMDEVTVQATLCAEVNLITYTAGLLTDLRGIPPEERIPIRAQSEKLPYKFRPSTRPAGGF